MSFLKITGAEGLSGSVNISGSKNSALCMICSCLLFDGRIELRNVPNISDVKIILSILDYLNVNYQYSDNTFIYFGTNLKNTCLLTPDVSKLRGSYYFMGSLISRYGSIRTTYPGGCQIGKRPIDFHFMAFECLGYNVSLFDEEVTIELVEKRSAEIRFSNKSMGGTLNAILASVYGVKTTIFNASIEPEVLDVISFLKQMGVDIVQIGDSIVITGRTTVIRKDIVYTIMYDRIEAGTFIALGLMRGPIFIKNADYKSLKSVIYPLVKANARISIRDNVIVCYPSKLDYLKVETAPYPGFPTDLAQIFSVIMAHNGGEISENIFESRLASCLELRKMGADVSISENKAIFKKSELNGCFVRGHDLRGSMSLLIAGLCAKGETILEGMNYIMRGYEDIIGKIRSLGGIVEIIE